MRLFVLRGAKLKRRWIRITGLFLIGTVCVASFGCFHSSAASRPWLDPLGLASQSELGEQPEFQRDVNRDRFPTASQIGRFRLFHLYRAAGRSEDARRIETELKRES